MIVAGVVFGMIIKLIKSIHGIIGFIIDPLFLGSKYPPAQSAIDLFKIIQCQSLIKKLSVVIGLKVWWRCFPPMQTPSPDPAADLMAHLMQKCDVAHPRTSPLRSQEGYGSLGRY